MSVDKHQHTSWIPAAGLAEGRCAMRDAQIFGRCAMRGVFQSMRNVFPSHMKFKLQVPRAALPGRGRGAGEARGLITDAEVGQVRGRCFLASLARIGHTASKATAMRIAGTPCLPILHLQPGRTHFGRFPARSMSGGTLGKFLHTPEHLAQPQTPSLI